MLSEVVAKLRAAGYEAELIPDLEHGLSEIEILYPNGHKLIFDWNLASYVEFSRSVELMRSLEASLPGPFIVGENGTSESITTREDLLERITTLAKKDLNIQRYKGLGEMNPNSFGKPQWTLKSERCSGTDPDAVETMVSSLCLWAIRFSPGGSLSKIMH